MPHVPNQVRMMSLIFSTSHFTTQRVLQMCEESSPPSSCTTVIHTYDKSSSLLPCRFVEHVYQKKKYIYKYTPSYKHMIAMM